MITSRNNSKLKRVRKLLTSAQERKKTGLFVAEGVRLVTEVPAELLQEVLVSDQARELLGESQVSDQKKALLGESQISDQMQELLGESRVSNQVKSPGFMNCPDVEVVEHTIFKQLSDTVHPQGILAVVQRPAWKEDEVLSSRTGKILLLDGIRDPGNLGTMIRTAEAAGVKAVYMSPDCVDLFNPKVIRSTMGSIFRVPVFSADLTAVIGRLKAAGTPVYATSLAAQKSFRDADLNDAGIIIGSEANGISDKVLSIATEAIKIPMAGQVESLNAAVSAAILMFA